MEKGKKTRRKILEIAFKLFSTYSYPDVSYSLLEEATDISRGSMVYYFKNKEGIFRAVLDTFFYGEWNVGSVDASKRDSLTSFFNAFISKMEGFVAHMRPYHIKNLCEARFNIERSAAQFIPEFKEQETKAQKKEIDAWEEAVRNSISSGEIKPLLEEREIAQLFHNTTMGFMYMRALNSCPGGLEDLRTSYTSLYSLLKS